MVYASLPSRKATTRWRLAGHRTIALMDGLRLFLAVALLVDSVRSFFTPDASLLGILVRWPGGHALPSFDGLVLAAAFLIRHRVAALVLVAHAVLARRQHRRVLRPPRAGAARGGAAVLARHAGDAARRRSRGPSTTAPTGSGRGPRRARRSRGPLLLLLHLFSFGATDYTRPARRDRRLRRPRLRRRVAVDALADRMTHGVRLYHQKVAPTLILSGAPDEVPTMRRLALKWRRARSRRSSAIPKA